MAFMVVMSEKEPDVKRHEKFYDENRGQRKRYQRHIENVLITGVIETLAVCRSYCFLWP